VGKSSLLNRLADRDAAIVSDMPGTTRDIVEVRMDLNGYLVTLQDTAGLRDDSDDAIELEGMRRSRAVAEAADLVLDLRDASVCDQPAILDAGPKTIPVWTKTDKLSVLQTEALARGSGVAISSKNGAGLDRLISTVLERLADLESHESELVPTRSRHAALLRSADSELETAVLDGILPIEVRAEHLRRAADHIGRITGKVDVEDLLGVIFAEFCVGK
jgi:tRNA modification GTPase